MGRETHEYTNGGLTVTWKPKLCTHSAKCALGLPQVFKPTDIPWIQMENGGTEELAETVARCPSGALSCYRK